MYNEKQNVRIPSLIQEDQRNQNGHRCNPGVAQNVSSVAERLPTVPAEVHCHLAAGGFFRTITVHHVLVDEGALASVLLPSINCK